MLGRLHAGMSIRCLLTIAASGMLLAGIGGCGGERSLSEEAADYRDDLGAHDRVGWILFGPNAPVAIVRAGIDQPNLDSGAAGWYQGSQLPGEGGVVYLAGHRTTHGGPFRPVGTLAAGDEVTFKLPYALATYRVTARRFIGETDTGILSGNPRGEQLRLQTSTHRPGSKRLIVFATLSVIESR
jgi:LPXTG-site transpeptidase (sortase) family protein